MFGFTIIKTKEIENLKGKLRVADAALEFEKAMNKISVDDRKRLNNLRTFEDVTLNMSILKIAGPEFLKEVIRNIQALQNDMLKKSTKIRDINGIAYVDGGSDFADKLKFELKQVLNRIVIDPNLTDPITGKKLKKPKTKTPKER